MRGQRGLDGEEQQQCGSWWLLPARGKPEAAGKEAKLIFIGLSMPMGRGNQSCPHYRHRTKQAAGKRDSTEETQHSPPLLDLVPKGQTVQVLITVGPRVQSQVQVRVSVCEQVCLSVCLYVCLGQVTGVPRVFVSHL